VEGLAEGRGFVASPDELAKEWLMRLIEGTSITDVQELPVEWIATEAPRLVAEILTSLREGEPDPELARGVRAGELVRLRRAEDASSQIPRDIAVLHGVIVGALGRSGVRVGDEQFAASLQRLSQIFGEIQARVTETLVRERAGNARRDSLTGLPGSPELHEWLRVFTAGQERYGHPFASLAIDIDGLKRINDAFGRTAGDRMLAAVADLIRVQVRSADRVFRIGGDEFCVLAPGKPARLAMPLAQRLRDAVEQAQIEIRPKVTITVGLASAPEHGEKPEELLEAAVEATYAAKASGNGIALAGDAKVQDS
jgi:diguanylate cyclase (GGDEF)-like protein